jgi:hypothetical protein
MRTYPIGWKTGHSMSTLLVIRNTTANMIPMKNIFVVLLRKPPAHQLELLPVAGGLGADLLVGKLGDAKFESVMVDERVQLR